jgi:hypothetical protein
MWPAVDREAAESTGSAMISAKNTGGAPRKWRDDLFIEIIRIANTPDGLPETKIELQKRLRSLDWKEDGPSDSTIYQIVSEVYDRVVSRT